MSPDILTVLHAPGHAPNMDEKVIERAEATGADTIGWSEAYKIAGVPLHNRPQYRTKVGRSGVSTRLVHSPMGDAGDNPIMVRRDHPINSHYATRITDPGPLGRLFKFTPERWLTVVMFEFGAREFAGRQVTHINAHPSPYFAGPRKWSRVMKAATREVHIAKARGDLVVLTGDLQTGKALPLLRAAGLTVWQEGVDYVGTFGLKRLDGAVFKVGKLDHPWLLGTYRAS